VGFETKPGDVRLVKTTGLKPEKEKRNASVQRIKMSNKKQMKKRKFGVLTVAPGDLG